MDLKCQWFMISLAQLSSSNGLRENFKFVEPLVELIWTKN